jgi:hypothetical protein
MAPANRGNIKGTVLVSRLKLLRDRGGEALVERVMRGLPADDVAILRGIVLTSVWYPFDMNERFDAAIVAAIGGGDETYRALGRQSAGDNLAAAHRNFARSPDPHAFFRQTASIYRVYYDTGTRTYEKLGSNKALVRTEGSESFSRTDCLTVIGYFERATEIVGGRDVKIDHARCRAKNDTVCDYLIEWT